MEQAKIAIGEQRIREQGAKTALTATAVDAMVQEFGNQVQRFEATGQLQHKHGGLLNTTVFESNRGAALRIQCTTRSNRQLSVQVYLD